MRIYIVEGSDTGYDYAGHQFLGAYSSREKAQAARERFSETMTYDHYTIRTATLDVDGYKPREEFLYDEQ